MRPTFAALAATALLAAAHVAHAQTLYDGSLNTSLSSQGWTYFAPGATQSVGGGATTFASIGSNALQGGYTLTTPSPMDRGTGYTLSFDLQVLSEAHASTDRAGVSLIALGSDKKGVELGFWTNQVWAQSDSPLFTHAEGTSFDTTGGLTHYDLSFSGGTYSLAANGATLLSGSVRDYTAFAGAPDPYVIPNLLFLGDDTASANGSFKISRITLTPTAAVPEPGTTALLGLGLLPVAGLAVRRRRPA